MSLPRISMTAQGRRTPFFPTLDYSSTDHPWAGYSFEEADSPAEPLPLHSWSKTTLLCVRGGTNELDWKHRGVWHKDRMQVGTVSIVRRDAEIQSAVPSSSMPMMVVQLDNSKLAHVAPDYVLSIERSLEAVQVVCDDQLAALLSAMRAEVREGCPSGRLYGESISLALLAYLAGRYAPQRVESGASKLAPSQIRTIVDYIRANLSSNISVTELAGLVGMSPSHFTRVFRASFGVAPYHFVMRERVEAAKEMLVGLRLSASQVAMGLGFASQSHFIRVFRQFTGVTPKQYRSGL